MKLFKQKSTKSNVVVLYPSKQAKRDTRILAIQADLVLSLRITEIFERMMNSVNSSARVYGEKVIELSIFNDIFFDTFAQKNLNKKWLIAEGVKEKFENAGFEVEIKSKMIELFVKEPRKLVVYL
ncbi:hypothetical protein [Weissella cibaria]|uniref:hypothetical protein n=1 Tax=Weissella cibaria TaxID=137591 RepID=UPI0013DB6034|nr:hypothetical protein [Weissella cibaria]NFA02969.1 hypothetical protein [Weissella cibaria]